MTTVRHPESTHEEPDGVVLGLKKALAPPGPNGGQMLPTSGSDNLRFPALDA